MITVEPKITIAEVDHWLQRVALYADPASGVGFHVFARLEVMKRQLEAQSDLASRINALRSKVNATADSTSNLRTSNSVSP